MGFLRIDHRVNADLRSEEPGQACRHGLLLGDRGGGRILGLLPLPPADGTHGGVAVPEAEAAWVRGRLRELCIPGVEILGSYWKSPAATQPSTLRHLLRIWESVLGDAFLAVSAIHVHDRTRRALRFFRGDERHRVHFEPTPGLSDPSEAAAIGDFVEEFWNHRERESGDRAPMSVLLDPGFERRLIDCVASFPEEIGGILLGPRAGAETVPRIAAAWFPPQQVSDRVRCEFGTHSLAQLCDALHDAAPDLRPVGWVHTHPGHGVFLSEDDRRTFAGWTALDPQAIALVVDPQAGEGLRLLACNAHALPVVIRRRAVDPGLALGGAGRLEQALRRTGGADMAGGRLVFANPQPGAESPSAVSPPAREPPRFPAEILETLALSGMLRVPELGLVLLSVPGAAATVVAVMYEGGAPARSLRRLLPEGSGWSFAEFLSGEPGGGAPGAWSFAVPGGGTVHVSGPGGAQASTRPAGLPELRRLAEASARWREHLRSLPRPPGGLLVCDGLGLWRLEGIR